MEVKTAGVQYPTHNPDEGWIAMGDPMFRGARYRELVNQSIASQPHTLSALIYLLKLEIGKVAERVAEMGKESLRVEIRECSDDSRTHEIHIENDKVGTWIPINSNDFGMSWVDLMDHLRHEFRCWVGSEGTIRYDGDRTFYIGW